MVEDSHRSRPASRGGFVRVVALAVALAVSLGPAASSALARAAPHAPARASRVVLPTDVVPSAYRIEFEPHADAGTFEASGEIDVDVVRATRRIVLNSADLVIDRAGLADVAATPAIAYDLRAGTARLTFPRPLEPGRHVLRLSWRGKIFEHASGLFALKYDTPAGAARALFTQFENSDARRFVPCWDEPARKATFELAAIVPEALMAVGNMPVAATEPLPGGRKRVRFAPTPRMSSYLLFFGLGDFERVHRAVGSVDVGVIVKRGDTASAAWALDVATQVLPFYDEYFGTPYPLPKLDMIAGPGGSLQFSAMENWGAIFYFEQALLFDPRISTEADRQGIYEVIAHEMAHQWFGNLVTMDWWDDIWLNEGFAQWMEVKAADHFHPEWKRWLRTLRGKQFVMGVDAREGTHPVVTRIDDVLQAASAFDSITYVKGAQVIRTLEGYLGEDAFRDGVRRYMAAHAYGNTVSDDLWHAMDAQGDRPVTGIAHDLTLQAGVPLVTELSAHCGGERTTLALAQDRFAIDATSTRAKRWQVPVVVATTGGGATRGVVAGPAPQAFVVDGCGTPVVNAGQTGYFRTRYNADGQRAVQAAYARLSPDDQLGIFNDTASLALAGRLPMATLLELARGVPVDADPLVVSTLAAQLRDIDRLHDGLPTRAAWQRFAGGLLWPMLARVGPRKTEGENPNVTIARADLIAALSALDDPGVIADARAQFDAFVAAPGAPIDAEQRKSMLAIVASHADAATWERLHALATSTAATMEKQDYYELLATARDPALAARALDLALSGEPPATIATHLVDRVGDRHPALAFDFAQAHWAALVPSFEMGGQSDFMPFLVYDAPDAALATRLDAFGRAHIPANARQTLRKAESNMRYRAGLRRGRLPEIDRWLAAQAP